MFDPPFGVFGETAVAAEPTEGSLDDPAAGLGLTITILDVGGMHRQIEGQADHIGHEMSLSAVDLLPGVIAASSAGLRGFHALAVDHARGR